MDWQHLEEDKGPVKDKSRLQTRISILDDFQNWVSSFEKLEIFFWRNSKKDFKENENFL